MSRQQELSMNGRRLLRSALLSIDDEDHPLYVLYKKYKKEFPKGDPLICACEKKRIKDVENMIQILLETNNKNVINNEGKTSRGISFTPLGIAAIYKGISPSKPPYEQAIKEGEELSMDLSREEKEFHLTQKGLALIFYS